MAASPCVNIAVIMVSRIERAITTIINPIAKEITVTGFVNTMDKLLFNADCKSRFFPSGAIKYPVRVKTPLKTMNIAPVTKAAQIIF